MPQETEYIAEPPPANAVPCTPNLHSAAQRAYKDANERQTDSQHVERFIPMVHKIARRAASYLKPPLSHEDLVSAGIVGLVKAARDYNPSHQAEFKTYAYIRIRGAILDELRGWSFVPPAVHRQIRRAKKTASEITNEKGTPPTDQELADKLDISIDKLYAAYDGARAQQFISMHGENDDTPQLANLLPCPETATPDEALEKQELIEKLAEAIQQLDERQRHIIVLYYQQNLTMKQIAEVFNITEPRVSQLHAAAIFSLSTRLRHLTNGTE